ncbi:hypothetical protein BEN30_04595 [Magnetovibrio blakemorei]|uniref:Uncharacterized protein n=1 Tax=Magnetovibrio blakemorei TaxID=28181 RepID=A0A1E5QAJ3_9PROT|nr:hypothetical protein BEN30_04595 [Magnetovibrio blakemorei]
MPECELEFQSALFGKTLIAIKPFTQPHVRKRFTDCDADVIRRYTFMTRDEFQSRVGAFNLGVVLAQHTRLGAILLWLWAWVEVSFIVFLGE